MQGKGFEHQFNIKKYDFLLLRACGCQVKN